MYKIYLRHAYPNELYHHGILGMKWGIRRYQNKDGSLTAAGKKRYGVPSFTKTKNAINNMISPEHKKRLSTELSSLTKDPESELKIQKDVYNSLSRDEQLDLIRNDPNAVKNYYAKLDKARHKSDSVQNKAQRADSAIDELKAMGFSDDNTRDPKDHWLSKNIKTKHGDVEFFTNIDTTDFGMNGGTGSSPINASDIRTIVSGVNKYGSKAMTKVKAKLDSDIKNGYWGSADVGLGNIETVYAVKFRDLGAPSCEVSVPVKDKSTKRTYGWLSVEMDPITGNLENVSYND